MPRPHTAARRHSHTRIPKRKPPGLFGKLRHRASAPDGTPARSSRSSPRKTARLTWHLSLREGTKLPADERPPGPRTLTADDHLRPLAFQLTLGLHSTRAFMNRAFLRASLRLVVIA